MAQPHIRDPPQPAAPPLPPGAPGAAAEAAAEPAAFVPDVMRCRWRRDAAQRRLLPRLRGNARAMGLAALVLAIAASNSLLVPLALEARPAGSQRCAPPAGPLCSNVCMQPCCNLAVLPSSTPQSSSLFLPPPLSRSADQILRYQKELAFIVATGRQADTALWYQRLASATQQADWAAAGGDGGGGNATASEAEGLEDMGGGYGNGGVAEQGAAGFLAAALEGSSNSSRLDAKLAVSGEPKLLVRPTAPVLSWRNPAACWAPRAAGVEHALAAAAAPALAAGGAGRR